MSSHFFSPKIRGQERKTIRVRASEGVARERRGTEPLVAPKSEDASNSSHVKHSNSRTHAQLVCARRNFLRKQEAARSMQQFEAILPMNSLQLSRQYHGNKNVHVDQSIYYWHFSAKYEDNKTCLFLLSKLRSRIFSVVLGHIKLCLFLMFKFLKTISLLLCVLRVSRN